MPSPKDLTASGLERTGIERHRFTSGPRYLAIEVLDDDLVHFELSEQPTGPDPMAGIFVTPMVDATAYASYAGPTAAHFAVSGNVLETRDLRITVSLDTLGVAVEDKARGVFLADIGGRDLDKGTKTLQISRGDVEHIYGIGNLFYDIHSADGDWRDRVWNGRNHGNFRFGPYVGELGEGSDLFHGGGPSVSQFPIYYAVGRKLSEDVFQNYALFLDHPYRMSWDFCGDTWKARSWGDQIRWFFFAGANLKDLRSNFLRLVGRPPLPPREMFGLWISEFGFDNWAEIRREVESLQNNRFPVDGVCLDLQWFGGTFDNNEHDANCEPDRMGSLEFDPVNFPSPEQELAGFFRDHGVKFMTIEESYVDNRRPEYQALWQHRHLARVSDDEPVTVTRDFRRTGRPDHCVWWGRGGMIDWSNPAAGDYWHREKRLNLARMGITSHWLDLGEPEMYYENAIYHGLPKLGKNRHGDIHNFYNLFWAESISRGYRDGSIAVELAQALSLAAPPRHFALSRSGTVGSQRHGGMWSGDVRGNVENLVAHLNTQMHMSLAGVDYYSSDAGGFFPEDRAPYRDEIYTQWFAINCLLDIPVRPHAWSLPANGREDGRLSPDQRGHLTSNRANLRLRYGLAPYLYSLAHLAWWEGEAIFPPLVLHYQGDLAARRNGNVKLIGRNLLFGVVAGIGQVDRRVYLPAGQWVDYHSLDWFVSNGEETPPIPLYRDRDGHRSLFTLPLFARSGAIIPQAYVDDLTRNVRGRRDVESALLTEAEKAREQVLTTELRVRVFTSPQETAFQHFEDDGSTVAYLHGQLRRTRISQQCGAVQARVTFDASEGDFPSAVKTRNCAIELVTDGQWASGVAVNGEVLPALDSLADINAGQVGWVNAGRNRILARSASGPTDVAREFLFDLEERSPQRAALCFICTHGPTQPGEAIYVSGNVPELGQWEPARAVRLEPVRYPKWSVWIADLPPDTLVEWKFLRRAEAVPTSCEWEHAGVNHRVRTPRAGFGGTVFSGFPG